MISAFLALSLGVAAPTSLVHAADTRFESSSTQEDDGRSNPQGTMLAHLETARLLVQENPERGLPIALALLSQLQEHPRELNDSPELASARLDTILEVARAELSRGDQANAAIHVDEALWIDTKLESRVQNLGPSMIEFVANRLEQRENSNHFKVFVQCGGPCEIYVNEVKVEEHEIELPLGFFRLTVLDPSGRLPALNKEIIGTLGETTMSLTFGAPPVAPAPAIVVAAGSSAGTPPPRVPSNAAKKAWLPRWAPWTALAVGAGSGVLGGVLIGIDGKCNKATGPRCDARYRTKGMGWAGVGVGASLSIGALVVLIHDFKADRK
jgi:hypothetical protein